jgi:isopenicillin-N epimerase
MKSIESWQTAYPEDWDVPQDILYLNHGAFGLTPRAVLADQRQWQARNVANPMDFYLRQLEPAWWTARDRLAQFVGTDANNLAFCPCATTGMNHIASFFPLKPGQEVLLNNHEYGAVKKIWKRRCQQTDACYREIDIPFPIQSADQIIQIYEKEIHTNTRIIILSQITSPTAIILPVAELTDLAHRRSAAVCIDGPHTILQYPLHLDELRCDFYTASCHKWLCAPLGCGFTFISPQWHEQAEPFEISWGRLPPGELRTWSDHQIWVGTRDYSPYLSVPSAIELFEKYNLNELRIRNHRLAQYVRNELAQRLGTEPVVPNQPGPYANALYGWMAAVWLPAGDWSHLQKKLWDEDRIEVPIISFDNRYLIRVSCHLYYGKEEMNRLIDAVSRQCRAV